MQLLKFVETLSCLFPPFSTFFHFQILEEVTPMPSFATADMKDEAEGNVIIESGASKHYYSEEVRGWPMRGGGVGRGIEFEGANRG